MQLVTQFKGVSFNIGSSPCGFVFHFDEPTELRTSKEISLSNVDQGWRGERFMQRGTKQEGFFAYATQPSWEAYLLQVQAVRKGRSPYSGNTSTKEINPLRPLAVFTCSRSYEVEICWSFYKCSMLDPRKLPSGIYRKKQHSANTLRPNCLHPGTRTITILST